MTYFRLSHQNVLKNGVWKIATSVEGCAPTHLKWDQMCQQKKFPSEKYYLLSLLLGFYNQCSKFTAMTFLSQPSISEVENTNWLLCKLQQVQVLSFSMLIFNICLVIFVSSLFSWKKVLQFWKMFQLYCMRVSSRKRGEMRRWLPE